MISVRLKCILFVSKTWITSSIRSCAIWWSAFAFACFRDVCEHLTGSMHGKPSDTKNAQYPNQVFYLCLLISLIVVINCKIIVISKYDNKIIYILSHYFCRSKYMSHSLTALEIAVQNRHLESCESSHLQMHESIYSPPWTMLKTNTCVKMKMTSYSPDIQTMYAEVR